MHDLNSDWLRLAPFVLGRVRRGVVGNSRYAKRLRNAIHDAARDADQQPVLICGEPGLGKDNLAALIHFGSEQRRALLLRFNALDLQGQGAALLAHLGSTAASSVRAPPAVTNAHQATSPP